MTLHPELAEAASAFQRGDLDRARALAGSAAAIGKAGGQAEYLLGLIDCRSGDLESGIANLRRAADAEPGNGEYRLMLARALIDAGQPAEALELSGGDPDGPAAALAFAHVRAEAATALQDWTIAAEAWQSIASARPLDWRAWSSLGRTRAALQRWPESVDALRRAAQINPQDAAVRRDLAAAFEAIESFEDSGEQLDAARALDPGNPDIHLALARILGKLGRDEEALAELQEAERCGAQSIDLSIGRGRALAALARFEDAEEAYRGAIAQSPVSATPVRELGLLLERTGRRDEARSLVEAATEAGVPGEELSVVSALLALDDGDPAQAKILLAGSSPEGDPVRWHRLMARIADALGEPEDAFASASAMNLATPRHGEWRARGAAYRDRIRSLLPVLTPDWSERLPQLPPSSRRSPAFLVGFPRSGTTLLDTFLMGHPDCFVLEEVQMLDAAERVSGRVGGLPDCSPQLLEQARQAYFDELDRHVDKSFEGLVVDKLPLNMLGMPLIRCLFPDAPVIFAQRHPCDAVLSGFMQDFVLNDAMACFLDIGDAADLYDAAMQVWSRSRELLPIAVHDLVYEELIADAAGTLRPLIDFLRLDWHKELLDHRSTARQRGAILTPSYNQVTQPLNQRPVGRWRRYEDQLAPVLPTLLGWAQRLGYSD